MNTNDPNASPDYIEEFIGEFLDIGNNGEYKLGSGSAGVSDMPVQHTLIELQRRKVSGSYKASSGMWKLELRIDVDGNRPMSKVSADLYIISGATTSYFGSFIVNTPAINYENIVTIEGIIESTYSTPFKKIKVSVQRNTVLQSPGAATIQFFSLSGSPGAIYIANFNSIYFRSMAWEQDCQNGVTPFSNYETGALPSGGTARNLSVVSAYAEAGIQINPSGTTNVVSGEGNGTSWSNSELHKAMEENFSLWEDGVGWKVWSFAAQIHDKGTGLYGIMFDQKGNQRQGCATFYKGIGGTTADRLRLQLYTHVHELGHCFNLLHSWQKSSATPPIPNRDTSFSWMNYPWNRLFPDPDFFWNNFAFQFDSEELIHLRHGFLANIIMGANNFGQGAALKQDDLLEFESPLIDNSGLELRLESKKNFEFGEPVVVELKLSSIIKKDKSVIGNIHPNFGNVKIAIEKPNGSVFTYEPMIDHCCFPEVITLKVDKPAIYDSAYIGYGKDGFYFKSPGNYKIVAVYYNLDNSKVVSNPLTIRIKSSMNAENDEIAELYSGDEQGQLFYLLGSDSNFLKDGNDEFELVIDKYGRNPLSVYAKFVKGINETRNFKTISGDKKISVRKADTQRASKHLKEVVEHSINNSGLDNISLNYAFSKLTSMFADTGDKESAKVTSDQMIDTFKAKKLNPIVLNQIDTEAKNLTKDC